ncbi:MAG: aspartate 1-decarboxylase [Immundisolibacter sp.]
MIQFMLKAKLHRVTVTRVELDYEGSCAIDADLLEASGIREYEQIDIYNIANGERFTTYAIRAERGSRVISVNGAAAHKARVGDKIIIAAYCGLDRAEIQTHKPRLIYVDDGNAITRIGNDIPEQAA